MSLPCADLLNIASDCNQKAVLMSLKKSEYTFLLYSSGDDVYTYLGIVISAQDSYSSSLGFLRLVNNCAFLISPS